MEEIRESRLLVVLANASCYYYVSNYASLCKFERDIEAGR